MSFKVTCKLDTKGNPVTVIRHDNEEATKVEKITLLNIYHMQGCTTCSLSSSAADLNLCNPDHMLFSLFTC